jgi:hypothetical protein
MSDGYSLIPITDEQAKLGQEVIKAFRGLGAFLDKALGSTPEDLIGYFGGDRLRVRRAENMARMLFDARECLAARRVERTEPATLSVALPILQAAADEDRDEIVDLWARLLANAMDPSLRNVRQSYIEAIKKMDPPDALALRYLHQNKLTAVRPGDIALANSTVVTEGHMAKSVGLRVSALQVSLSNLESAGFLGRGGDDLHITSRPSRS